MITKKELDYVSSWASKVPYPGTKYAEDAMANLVDAVNNFNKYYLNKQYELVLSNGEQISFGILEKNLCHLLGIDFKNLTSDYFKSYRSSVLGFDENYIPKSFDLLNSIINNISAVIKFDYENGGKAINYYRVMIKCAIFEKLSDFSRFNFGVINFDKYKYINLTNTKFSADTEKYLYVQSNEPSAPYFMMGILHNTPVGVEKDNVIVQNAESNDNIRDDKYVPNTLMAPVNVIDFFHNQEVVIPTQILVTTPDKMEKIEATPSEKIALLNQYKAIISEYGIPSNINIYGDYECLLSAYSKKRVLTNG